MKQGIDPNTHMPINDKDSMHPNSSSTEQQSYNFSNFGEKDNLATKQAYDPLFLSEFQSNVDIPDYFQSNFLSHSHQNLVRPYDVESDQMNPITRFSSMPDLAAFNHQMITDTHHSSSRMNKLEVKDGPNVVNFQHAMNPMNNNDIVETGGPFGWEDEHKLDSIFQFHFSGIQIQQRNYPSLSQELTGENMDVLHNSM